MRVEIPVGPLAVEVGEASIVRAGAGDQHVVDRRGQLLEERLQLAEVGGVEGRGALRAEFHGCLLEPVGVSPGEDDVRGLSPGAPGGLQPDAGAAADHHDRLPG